MFVRRPVRGRKGHGLKREVSPCAGTSRRPSSVTCELPAVRSLTPQPERRNTLAHMTLTPQPVRRNTLCQTTLTPEPARRRRSWEKETPPSPPPRAGLLTPPRGHSMSRSSSHGECRRAMGGLKLLTSSSASNLYSRRSHEHIPRNRSCDRIRNHHGSCDQIVARSSCDDVTRSASRDRLRSRDYIIGDQLDQHRRYHSYDKVDQLTSRYGDDVRYRHTSDSERDRRRHMDLHVRLEKERLGRTRSDPVRQREVREVRDHPVIYPANTDDWDSLFTAGQEACAQQESRDTYVLIKRRSNESLKSPEAHHGRGPQGQMLEHRRSRNSLLVNVDDVAGDVFAEDMQGFKPRPMPSPVPERHQGAEAGEQERPLDGESEAPARLLEVKRHRSPRRSLPVLPAERPFAGMPIKHSNSFHIGQEKVFKIL